MTFFVVFVVVAVIYFLSDDDNKIRSDILEAGSAKSAIKTREYLNLCCFDSECS